MLEDKKLKIAYVIPRFYPFKGGTEINCYAIASRMAKLGHEVTIITTDVKYRNEQLPKEEMVDGMKVVRIHAWSDALYAGFYPGLLKYLLINKFDLIHSHGIGFFWREMCLLFTKLFRFRKTKFIVTLHGPFMALNDKSGIRGMAKKYGTLFLRLYLNKLYDGVVQVTSEQSKWMTFEYNFDLNKIFLVPNGIDSSMIEKEVYPHSVLDKIVITFIGRMEWYKGAQDLISAADSLKKSNKYKKFKEENPQITPDFEVKILGRAGNYTEKLKDLIEKLEAQDTAELIYSPSDEERDRILYEESQINVLPSKWEGTGIVLLEAMAKGNVVISTKQNDALDLIIEEGVTGYSYNFADVDALEDILFKLITKYDLRQKIREENLKRSVNFTWDGVMPSYLKMVGEVTSK